MSRCEGRRGRTGGWHIKGGDLGRISFSSRECQWLQAVVIILAFRLHGVCSLLMVHNVEKQEPQRKNTCSNQELGGRIRSEMLLGGNSMIYNNTQDLIAFFCLQKNFCIHWYLQKLF